MKRYKPVDWVKPLHRLGGFPVDITSLFDNLEEAMSYVHTNGTAYAGQIISIIDEDAKTVKVYKVAYDAAPEDDNKNALTLQEITSGSSVGGSTILETFKVAGQKDGSLGGYNNGDYVIEGQEVTDVLKKLLQKEIFPGSATLPSISISLDPESYGGTTTLYAVGTELESPKAKVVLTNGSFDDANGQISQVSPNATWGSQKLTASVSGFGGTIATSSSTGSLSGGETITVGLGENKIVYTAEAVYSAPSVSPVTNLGNTVADSSYTWAAGTANASKTIIAIGVYPLYTNGQQNYSGEGNTSRNTASTSIYTADDMLVNTGMTFYVDFVSNSYETISGATPWTLYVPSVYSFTPSNVMAYNPMTGKYDIKAPFTLSDEKITYDGVEYNIYECKNTDTPMGSTTARFILS